jgi:hypothetical protein
MTIEKQSILSYQPSTAFSKVKSAKKRVTLNPKVSVLHLDAKPMTKVEKSDLYYTKDDLRMINHEVKAISALSKQLTQTQPHITCCIGEQDNNNNCSSSNCALAVEARGLEFRIHPQRFRNKLIARRALRKYQKKLQTKCTDFTPDEKAEAMRVVSEKLSALSHLVAQETARIDSLRAYDGDYLIPLDDPPSVQYSTFPNLTAKRKESFGEVRSVTPEEPPRPFHKARTA